MRKPVAVDTSALGQIAGERLRRVSRRGDRGDLDGEFIWEIHGDNLRAPNTPDTLW